MRTYKLTIAYDGTRYQGWQRQADTDRTIQGILERAISGMCRTFCRSQRFRENGRRRPCGGADCQCCDAGSRAGRILYGDGQPDAAGTISASAGPGL